MKLFNVSNQHEEREVAEGTADSTSRFPRFCLSYADSDDPLSFGNNPAPHANGMECSVN